MGGRCDGQGAPARGKRGVSARRREQRSGAGVERADRGARLPGGVAAGRGCPCPSARLREAAPGGLRAGLRGAGSAAAVGGGAVEGALPRVPGAAVPFSLLGAAPAVSCGTARLSPPAHGSGCGRTGCPSGLAAAFPTPSPVGGPGAGRGSPRLRGGGVRLRGEAGRDPPARPQALCNRRGCHGGSPRSGPTWPRPRDGALPLELRAASPGRAAPNPLEGSGAEAAPALGKGSAPRPSRRAEAGVGRIGGARRGGGAEPARPGGAGPRRSPQERRKGVCLHVAST